MNQKILVVDDSEDIVEIVKFRLEEQGFEVLTAKNGEDGLAVWLEKNDEIALVISDNIMPDMTGCQMIEKARSFQLTTDVIMFSSDGLNGYHGTFVPKPFFGELINAVKRQLDYKPPTPPPPAPICTETFFNRQFSAVKSSVLLCLITYSYSYLHQAFYSRSHELA
jgi:DNA-binding response OmpR family regulator